MINRNVILLLLVLIIPTYVFAVSNARINEQKSVTITQLPFDLVFTCDLAASGNKLVFEFIVDADFDGIIAPIDEVVGFFIITDGIGWIRDPDNPEADLAGDETGVDGKLRSTFKLDQDDIYFPNGMTIFLRVTDEDGSSELLTLKLQITLLPPIIQGKITDAVTGLAIPNCFVVAETEDASNYGISDNDGNYQISVKPGTYKVAAMQMPMTQYQPSDSVMVTVAGTETVVQNFALQSFGASVKGKLTKISGEPVPGIMIMATGDAQSQFFSFAVSDANGNFSFGVVPGTVLISPSYILNVSNDNWPKDHFVSPSTDTIIVAQGQTGTSNFVFNPYTAFITGKCTINGIGLPNVSIHGYSFDLTTFTMNFYETISDQNGNYRLGVLPGIINSVTADIAGYDVQSPAQGGYFQVYVAEGQTVSAHDFAFAISDPKVISGRVTFGDGAPVSNVYVVAKNQWEENSLGFLINYTDANGHFRFDNPLDGSYQLGIFKSGYSSDPVMRYFYLDWLTTATDQNFVLHRTTGIETRDHAIRPLTIHLFQNYPNPFNPSTSIKFQLPEPEQVTITIFNAAGQIIRVLADGTFAAGEHRLEWDGTDHSGHKVSSGIYFYQLNSNGFSKVMRMTLMK